MKTNRKLRQRRLALNMAEPLHPVDYESGKAAFERMWESRARQFAAKSK